MGEAVSFKVGSCAFFSKFEDFKPHDEDYVVYTDETTSGSKYEYAKIDGNDYFIYKTMSKNEIINFMLKNQDNLVFSAFLIPEVIKYFGITFDDLVFMGNNFKNMDEKHKYITMIYDYYIKNGDFYLTDDQLLEVYEEYKKERKSPNIVYLNKFEKEKIINYCKNIK